MEKILPSRVCRSRMGDKEYWYVTAGSTTSYMEYLYYYFVDPIETPSIQISFLFLKIKSVKSNFSVLYDTDFCWRVKRKLTITTMEEFPRKFISELSSEN
jgi:hypothetical protein